MKFNSHLFVILCFSQYTSFQSSFKENTCDYITI